MDSQVCTVVTAHVETGSMLTNMQDQPTLNVSKAKLVAACNTMVKELIELVRREGGMMA